jgi:DNA invertase Pin-like site-specific DNA recombinase
VRRSRDDKLGIDRQREDCIARCKERGWAFTEYPDNDRSASNGKARPGY